jgi:hypothetical protein
MNTLPKPIRFALLLVLLLVIAALLQYLGAVAWMATLVVAAFVMATWAVS